MSRLSIPPIFSCVLAITCALISCAAARPWMIYIREARRMVTDYVMTQLDCSGTRKAPDPEALQSVLDSVRK